MNILYVHNVGKIGGAERVTLDVIRGLDRNSHTAFLVTPEDGPFILASKELGCQASALKIQQPDTKKPFVTLQGYRRWLGFLRENEIDLIHTGDLFVTRTLLRPANKLGIPVVCHVHFPIEASALSWIFRAGSDKCHFVYCSQELHDTVSPRVETVLKAASHRVIHNGVNVDQFKAFEPKHGLLPTDKTNIGIVANLQERKGHLDLIDAVATLHPDHPDIRIHIIGGDIFGESREPLLKERIEQLMLSEVFVFHGQVDNVRDYLNELNILVCASHEEAFPISILEAMAFRLPIASTDVNGIPEALIHEFSGLLSPPKSPEKLAENIARLLSDNVLRDTLGSHARQQVIQKFSLSSFRKKIESLYKHLGKES
jgi:glycosyltransferase involved in cell wall biosynthesis